jgi:precorrin-2/cobalt-factor-2 C20-methyltransferase
MLGKLFVVGVGPGDPELLTLKAVRILRTVSCMFVPKGREEGTSLALSIIQGEVSVEGKEIVEAYFPMRKTRSVRQQDIANQESLARYDVQEDMKKQDDLAQDINISKELSEKWAKTVSELVDRLNNGTDVAFITIGDPSIYSTFFYLYDRVLELLPSLSVEIVPGISSINAAAARVNTPLGLGNERIAVLPANYLADLRQTLHDFDTVVLMKINTVYGELITILDEMGLRKNAVVVSRAFMEDERVFKDLDKLDGEDLSYFSLMIVRK